MQHDGYILQQISSWVWQRYSIEGKSAVFKAKALIKFLAYSPQRGQLLFSPSFPEVYGRDVPAVIEQPLEEERIHIGKNTVTYEARMLKALFYEVIGWND